MAPQRSEYTDIAQIIQSTLEPLMAKLDTKIDRLELKVNHLSEDRVTRADIEKLRSELQANLVPRDSYEARHAALIAHDADMETRFKKHEEDAQSIVQRIYEKFELSNHQMEEKLKESQNAHLNDKDRQWIRFNQFFGIVAVIVAIAGLVLDHVRLQ